ncbi:hypothetical protein NLO74_22285 [Pseudomonas tremae]|uniref:MaoC-like dehydratase n=2 Tax=Pseudomonas coronafaciens TaxID=53409 RepID=A0AAE6QJS8_9PSED|nr:MULTISPECIES: hypothetical protein [Pseudomonas syringae group]KGS11551.1 hypothetical protein OA77_26525 [Pseudomonas coronafaciens]MCF5711134.1 hypothetical protein [Pseudomonas tremae]MCF5744934.1 hypothetical protein [Pseudomonas tremae]MCF5804487.1 hypothetical protein [Pseudomonas tremae]MCF5808010.1 hypothetical protein [Pseudomonas tremae]
MTRYSRAVGHLSTGQPAADLVIHLQPDDRSSCGQNPSDKEGVRFIQPLPVSARVRFVVRLTDVTEVEGQEKPAFIAEPLTLCFV